MTIKILLLFIFPFLAGLIPLFIKKQNTKFINILLVVGGSYLLCVCLYHLIPEAFSYNNSNSNIHTIGLFILLGFLMQLMLEQLSHGMEHGHGYKNFSSKLYKYNASLLISLSIHSFTESIPLAYSSHNIEIVLGIAIHHIPIGILLTNYSVKQGCSRFLSILAVVIFSVASPLGYLLGFFIINSSLSHISPFVTAFASGIMLYIATTVLFESSSSEHIFNKASLLSIILGILLFFIINLSSPAHHHVH